MQNIGFYIIEDITDLMIKEEEDNIIFLDPLLHIIYTDSIGVNIGKCSNYKKDN